MTKLPILKKISVVEIDALIRLLVSDGEIFGNLVIRAWTLVNGREFSR